MAGMPLDEGRACCVAEAWRDGMAALRRADALAPLPPDDLELLARCAYMLGQDDEYVAALERAHRGHLAADAVPRAVRCAFWIGHSFLFRGSAARAAGWFALAERLMEDQPADLAEHGWLLAPRWLEQMARGDWAGGHAAAARAAGIAERCGDHDLYWLARDDQARALVKQGRVEDGLRITNEALLVVGSGLLTPIVRGIVYCNTIDFCRDAFELGSVREWTEALGRWCEERPQMVTHNGLCLVHRAEMCQLRGDWAAAMAGASEAAERFRAGALNRIALGKAHYRRAEIHRLEGRPDEAEESYRAAHECGCEPQPGLALLRVAQGRTGHAAAMIQRAMTENPQGLQRAALLPAYVEIMLAEGDVEAARTACDQLKALVRDHRTEVLALAADSVEATVVLAEGDGASCLRSARAAAEGWQRLDQPYETARTRVLLARACRERGDEEGATMELEAARTSFVRLRAAPDLAVVEALLGIRRYADRHGLSDRELEVLRLVASGLSNKRIADDLVISPHTVARHVQNIFAKLGVTSRTAAGAYAFENGLL